MDIKTHVFFLIFLFTSLQLVAQQSEEWNLPKKYKSVFLGIGPRILNTDPGTIVTAYTDESPSMDNLETSIEVEDNYTSIGFELGYMWGKYEGLGHSLLFDFSLGKNAGGLFSYSLGYNFPIKIGTADLIMRPAFFAGFGNYGFKIGEIQNNAAYIEINGIQFRESELNVSLSSQVLIYGPELDFRWMTGRSFDAFLNLNYNLKNKNSRPEVVFKSPNGDNTTSLEIDTDNPTVTYNGEKLLSLPYDISGLRVTLGVAYVW